MKFLQTSASLLLLSASGCGPQVPSGLGAAHESPPPASGASTPIDASTAPSSSANPPAPSSPDIDEAAILASIAQGRYRTSPAFTELTLAPYPSVAAPGAMILAWVSTASLGAYAAISPEATGSHATTPEGTTIVRAVLGTDGGVAKLTLMSKGPRGYNPALGDWWFAVTDPNGTPFENDAGAEVGRMSGCYSCHVPRGGDDYLFGVPLDDRADAGGVGSADAGSGDAASDAGNEAGNEAGSDAGHHHH